MTDKTHPGRPRATHFNPRSHATRPTVRSPAGNACPRRKPQRFCTEIHRSNRVEYALVGCTAEHGFDYSHLSPPCNPALNASLSLRKSPAQPFPPWSLRPSPSSACRRRSFPPPPACSRPALLHCFGSAHAAFFAAIASVSSVPAESVILSFFFDTNTPELLAPIILCRSTPESALIWSI